LIAWDSGKRGNKFSLMIMLVSWMKNNVIAYGTRESIQFYMIAVLVVLVMGGIQSTSRAAYAKLLDGQQKENLNSYYSFYEVLEKAAIVFGTFSFGLIDQLSGSMRNSILALTVYFIVGLLILSQVRFRRSV